MTRYMVSYLALLCPMIAVCIQRGTDQDRRRPVRHAITGIVCFLCVMEAVSVTAYHYNAYAHRGADSRPWGYFVSRKGEAGYYVEVTNDIKDRGYESIGLNIGSDDYEYPIWKMLGKQRIEHINVQNESGIYRDETFTPDCIIWFGKPPEDEVRINDAVYIVVRDYGENHYLLGTQ